LKTNVASAQLAATARPVPVRLARNPRRKYRDRAIRLVALLLESYYTIWMEALLPKRRILELYANVIEMGRGIYAVEAASQHYFGVSSHGLTRGAVGHADGSPAESEGLGSGEAKQDIALAPATYFAP